MCRKTTIHTTSDQWNDYSVSEPNSIGALFRDYGESYICTYKPHIRVIKFIRSVRLCRTPGLGWTVYTCKHCGKKHTIYKSCGNSQCPICQSIKREQWIDKLSAKMLKIPYIHGVFTLPHQLNGLARANPYEIYDMIMRASWETVSTIFEKKKVIPGMTAVLHTFGSDMKYHIHVHALVTFGGLDHNGKWVYPENKYKIASYRSMCSVFKQKFITRLKVAVSKQLITYHSPLNELIQEVRNLRWVVHTTRPTTNTSILKSYLGRYINRIAISNNRLKYLAKTNHVALIHNDYKNQKTGCPAPKSIKHMTPITAIQQMVQHVLPRYFQKSRHYGLHNACNNTKQIAEDAIKTNPSTIRTALQIINALLKREIFRCEACQGIEFYLEKYPSDRTYLSKYLAIDTERAPPNWGWNRPSNGSEASLPGTHPML